MGGCVGRETGIEITDTISSEIDNTKLMQKIVYFRILLIRLN